MSQETFFNYKNYLYFWISILILVGLTVIYILDTPLGGPNGGTVLGYSYGGLATAGILYLMWYGIRKRSYHASVTTLKGTLAAHVWIGIALLLVVPLHSGFQFGVNVHTLAYLLMSLVVLSGIWGAINYATLTTQIQAHRGGGSHKELIQQIESLSRDIERSLSGGKSDELVQLAKRLDVTFQPSVTRFVRSKGSTSVDRKLAAELLAALPSEERQDGSSLVELINKKVSLINQLKRDVTVLYWLKVWLYFHVPLSFALLAALAIHIFAVFYNW